MKTVNNNSETHDIHELYKSISNSDIASVKGITFGLLNLINSPTSTIEELKVLVDSDPALASKILRSANSARYFSRVSITSIDKAVMWLGLDKLKEITLNQAISSLFNRETNIGSYSTNKLWMHCIAVANMSKLIYRQSLGQSGANAYAAGLLHDIGLIAIEQFLPKFFKESIKHSFENETDYHRSEDQYSSISHNKAGSFLAYKWNLPKSLVYSINDHHNPENSPPEIQQLSSTVFIADNCCIKLGFDAGMIRTIDEKHLGEILDIMKIDNQTLQKIIKATMDIMNSVDESAIF